MNESKIEMDYGVARIEYRSECIGRRPNVLKPKCSMHIVMVRMHTISLTVPTTSEQALCSLCGPSGYLAAYGRFADCVYPDRDDHEHIASLF